MDVPDETVGADDAVAGLVLLTPDGLVADGLDHLPVLGVDGREVLLHRQPGTVGVVAQDAQQLGGQAVIRRQPGIVLQVRPAQVRAREIAPLEVGLVEARLVQGVRGAAPTSVQKRS